MRERPIDIIFHDIANERQTQELLKASGKFEFTCADPELGDMAACAVLGEEVGETCRAVMAVYGLNKEGREGSQDDRLGKLRGELIQVAAVAVAWLEAVDKRIALSLGRR